ncbi:hypothetical protein ACFL3Q_03495 [Planctomycetota bacterium]
MITKHIILQFISITAILFGRVPSATGLDVQIAGRNGKEYDLHDTSYWRSDEDWEMLLNFEGYSLESVTEGASTEYLLSIPLIDIEEINIHCISRNFGLEYSAGIKLKDGSQKHLIINPGIPLIHYQFRGYSDGKKMKIDLADITSLHVRDLGNYSTRYASIHLYLIDFETGRPIRGAKLSILPVRSMSDGTNRTQCKTTIVKTDDSGRVHYNGFNLTGSARGGKAQIGKIYPVVHIKIVVEATGYRRYHTGTVITYDNPRSSLEIFLRRGFREAWIHDRVDEIAAEGRIRLDPSPQDNVTSYPVVRAIVRNQNGLPLEGATVYIRHAGGDKIISAKTNRRGRVVFTPYDFQVFHQFVAQYNRAIMIGTEMPDHRREKEHTLELKAEVHGFMTGYQNITISTFKPLSVAVFHLQPRTELEAERW